MKSARVLGEHDDRQTDLNRLLMRLDSEPAKAWDQYRNLRCRLVKFFEWHQCACPEDLADKALDTVARKPQDEKIRDVSQFVVGVARKLWLETHKKSQRESSIGDLPGGEESLRDTRDHEHEMIIELDRQSTLACLRECLGRLNAADRALALDYYSAEEDKQKVHRQKLARAAGVTVDALRVRACRLREKLEQCASKCLESRRQKPTGRSRASSHLHD